MKIITWNINSINARFAILTKVLEKHSPDVLMLQETKSQDINFPDFEIKALGYEVAFRGQKSYNGVAVLTKKKPETVLIDIPGYPDANARFCQVEIDDIVFIDIYAPNGNPVPSEKFVYKLAWHEAMNKHLKKLQSKGKQIILGGDFNICPTKIDVHDFERNKNDALCQPESIKHYNRLINMGFVDIFRMFNTDPEQYTFWGYRHDAFNANRGWRIDFFLLTPEIAEKAKKCWVDADFRAMEKPSDHTCLILEI
jgi:exodeoxyribonuclease III